MGRMFGPPGFTTVIVKKLQEHIDWRYSNPPEYYRGYVPSQALLTVSDLIPPENLRLRQNASPTVRDFVEFARKNPEAYFLFYVIGRDREDERVSIEGACLPEEKPDTMKRLKELEKRAKGRPDAYDRVRIKGKIYICSWWD